MPKVVIIINENLVFEKSCEDFSDFFFSKLITYVEEKKKSHRRDSNPRPADYKSAAHPG